MIQIEQSALCAFEEDILTRFDRLVNAEARVPNALLNALASTHGGVNPLANRFFAGLLAAVVLNNG